MRSITLTIALLGLLACAVNVSGLKCYLCTWIDTKDEALKELVKHTDECEKNPKPPDEGSSKIDPSAHTSLRSADSELRQSQYPPMCATVTGKANGYPFIHRTPFLDGFNGTKDDTCDNGEGTVLKFEGANITEMQVCYCKKDLCNLGQKPKPTGGPPKNAAPYLLYQSSWLLPFVFLVAKKLQ